MRKCDFIIIGQGLAGSLLAYSLIKRGTSVMVIDNHQAASATQVAAGLINPVTGHRLNITDGFFNYHAQAKKLYWQIERDLNCDIYRPLKQTRLIKNAGQADFLLKRKAQTEYQSILNDSNDTGGWFSNKDDHPWGAIGVSETAVVNTKMLLHCMRNWLLERDAMTSSSFDYSRLKPNGDELVYREDDLSIITKKVIFCEGYQAISNPWLSELPFNLAKGEVLTIKPPMTIDRMLSWGKWLIPLANGNLKLGSNYIWKDQTLEPNSQTAMAFLADFEHHTKQSAELIRHEVGIRPSTTQRMPFVGPLSNLKHAYCLNGLGSKGCLIAPYYVNLLCENMLHNAPLPDKVTQWL